jgi:tRNA nucleotidyltransferase (CCA-adding enzyme)
MTLPPDFQPDERLDCYLVGGAVRDQLLGLPIKDRDWVVIGSTPEHMQELGYRAVGKDFPVFLHPVTREEYALARTERKTAAGHGGFEFNTAPDITLEEDLIRRDLTINAIARTTDGEIIDPYHGVTDLENRILRHVSEAFAEDPLRVLRVARFCAQLTPYGFTLAPETIELMRQIGLSGELNALTPERVFAELERALGTPAPQQFFTALRSSSTLSYLFPEIDRLFGVPQRAEYHPEIDCGVHTMMVLDQVCRLSDDTATRFAAVCHDLGKATTPADLLPRHHGHEERGAKITTELCRRLRAPKQFRELAELTARYHTHCHNAFELRTGSLLKLLLNLDSLRRPDRFAQFVLICEADCRGRLGREQTPYPQADYLREAHRCLQQIEYGQIAQRRQSSDDVAELIRREQLQVLAGFKKRYVRNPDDRARS